MSRTRVERRLADIGRRLRELRSDAAITAEQLVHVREEADDARLRALVSETPLATHDHSESRRHLDVLERHLASVRAEIIELERRQDALLDDFAASADRL